MFQLTDEFIKSYFNKEIPWGPVGHVTYSRTYSRLLTEGGRYQRLVAEHTGGTGHTLSTRETWPVSVCRVVEGTYSWQKRWCEQLNLPWSNEKAERSARKMYDLIFNMKFTPPGRGLWMMGTDYVWDRRNGAPLNNCAFVSTRDLAHDPASPFCFLMDMSMLGVGVGADTLGAGSVQIRKPNPPSRTYAVGDSREGWVKALRLVLESYTNGTTYLFDYSNLRGAGESIGGFGGTASGPAPLVQLVSDVKEILSPLIGHSITSAAIVDVFNAIGRCVVAGNIRRSAEIMFGSPDDAEFLSLKLPDQPRMGTWGWASNNSVIVTKGQDYTELAKLTAENGEPGYLWLENAQQYGRMKHGKDHKDWRAMGANPCMEQTLEPYELCCLVETYPSRCDRNEYHEVLKYAYLYAKTVSLIPTHDPRSNAVMMRNRRIGCSMSGIVQAIEKHGTRNFFNMCDDGYKYIQDLDEKYSNWLCVPTSIKTTSVKPSGTVSLLPGVSPGIHAPHSKYYYRVIRFASDSPYVDAHRRAGYKCVDLSPTEPNTTAIYFAVHEENCTRDKSDYTIWEQAELAAQMQAYWADNQVSCTITFKESERASIPKVLELYETRLKGISFLPENVAAQYDHAPYQSITSSAYKSYTESLQPVHWAVGTYVELHEVDEKYCDGDACELSATPSKQND